MDYSIYYRRTIDVGRISLELRPFDIFISAFNSSERVRNVFNDVMATQKFWLVHPEYRYKPLETPQGFTVIQPESLNEIEQVNDLLCACGDLSNVDLCIDITGFMRHVLVFLFAKLAYMGVSKVTALYSEPISYTKREETPFSTETSGIVRPVSGIAGNNYSQANDYLIIGVGYDHRLISEVSNHKDDSIVYPVFAFPSLSADMYQQSTVRAAESGDVSLRGEWITNRRFAPANDPFATAAVVRDIIADIDREEDHANIYLSPLSTKVQTLGFALYWQLEGRNRGDVSIILPECETYSRETSTGLRRLWMYTVEFD